MDMYLPITQPVEFLIAVFLPGWLFLYLLQSFDSVFGENYRRFRENAIIAKEADALLLVSIVGTILYGISFIVSALSKPVTGVVETKSVIMLTWLISVYYPFFPLLVDRIGLFKYKSKDITTKLVAHTFVRYLLFAVSAFILYVMLTVLLSLFFSTSMSTT